MLFALDRGWINHLAFVLTVISIKYGVADILTIDNANSTAAQANGIPQRVAPSIYIESNPLGRYVADTTRYARRDSNDALITYASARGFTSLAISGYSRETSDWTITAQYTVDGQPLQQKSFTIAEVSKLVVVDDTVPGNKWKAWILNISLSDSCPTDVGLVLSDSEGDNGWGLQIGKVEMMQSSTGCQRAKASPPPATSSSNGPVPEPVTATAIELRSDCIPKAESLMYCSSASKSMELKSSVDALDTLSLSSSQSNMVVDTTEAKQYFKGDKGRLKRGNGEEGSLSYHIDNGVTHMRLLYYRCEPTDASLAVVPYSDPDCMGPSTSIKGQPDKQPPSGCWQRYTAEVWFNSSSQGGLNASYCPPSDVKLLLRGGKDGSELQLAHVEVEGYGSFSSAHNGGDLNFPLLPMSGSKDGKFLPTKAWVPIVSCVLGAAVAALLTITYKCGGMKWVDNLLTGRDKKRQYGYDTNAIGGISKGPKGDPGQESDMEAPAGRTFSRQLSAAWAGGNLSQSGGKSGSEITRTGSGASVARASSLRRPSPPRQYAPDDLVLHRLHTHPSPHSRFFEPVAQSVRPSIAAAMTSEPHPPPPIRTRPQREHDIPSPRPQQKPTTDELTPLSTARSPLPPPETTPHDPTPTRTFTHNPTFTATPNAVFTPHDKAHTPTSRTPGTTKCVTPQETPTLHGRNTATPREGGPNTARSHTPHPASTPPIKTPTEGAANMTPGHTPTHTLSSTPPYGHFIDSIVPKGQGTSSSTNNAEGGKVLEERLADLQKKIVEIKKYLSHRKPDDAMTSNDKKLVMLKRIGQGGFGVVWKATWEGTMVAVKIMVFPNNMSGEEKAEKMALMEMAISGFLTHPNIVQTFTCEIRPILLEEATANLNALAVKLPSLVRRSTKKEKGSITQWMDWSTLRGSTTHDSMSFFSNKDPANNYSWELRIIMEYCDAGTLKDALRARRFLLDATPGLMMDHVLLTALDIARGVRHLHEHQVIHGDLKPHNILLRRSKSDTRGYVAKIADFGLSIKMQAKQTIVSGVTQGTDGYMSPEVIHQGKVLPASDVYSYGIMLWEVYTCRAVHDDLRSAKLPKHLITKWRPAFPANCPAKYVSLAQQCWDPNPYNRPTFKTIMDELSEMLKLVRRQTVHEAKQQADAVNRSGASTSSGPSTSQGPPEEPQLFPAPQSATHRIIFPTSNS